MKVIIKYIDYHWDNYQGGSGKSFEMKSHMDIPDSTTMGALWSFIHENLEEKTNIERPYKQSNKYSIISVELV